MNDAIAEVWYQWTQIATARNALSQAEALIAMSNAVSDLISWHPDYDAHQGIIRNVIEDEEN